MLASRFGYLKIVQLLINNNAKINTVYKNSYQITTALIQAVNNNHYQIANYLINRKANINALNKEQENILTISINNGTSYFEKKVKKVKLEFISILIKNKININQQNEDGKTPLMFAIEHGRDDIVKLLLNSGAYITIKDNNGMNAFLTLGKYIKNTDSDIRIAKLLVEYKSDINAKDNNGKTTLMYVASNGNFKLLKYLLSQHANIDMVDNQGNNILMWAMRPPYSFSKNHNEIIKSLIDLDLNINQKNDDNETALITLIKHNINSYRDKKILELLKILLSKGANINDKDKNGKTALTLSLRECREDVIKQLVDNGADVNILDNNKMTSLMLASGRDCSEFIPLLIDKGVYINSQDKDGNTALMWASKIIKDKDSFSWRGTEMAVKKLLSYDNIDINIKNNNNKTALMLAKEYDNKDVMKILKEFILKQKL